MSDIEKESDPLSSLLNILLKARHDATKWEVVAPLTASQIAIHDELKALRLKTSLLEKEAEIKRSMFWLDVEKQFGQEEFEVKDNILYKKIITPPSKKEV